MAMLQRWTRFTQYLTIFPDDSALCKYKQKITGNNDTKAVKIMKKSK